MQFAAMPVPVEYVPGTQLVQLEASDIPAPVEYAPAPHALQALGALAAGVFE